MTATEWGGHIENNNTVRLYFCTECKQFSGRMMTRRVTEGDNVHKEFKIMCHRCGQNGNLHWSKSLAEFSWKAVNPNFNDDFVEKDISEFTKKG